MAKLKPCPKCGRMPTINHFPIGVTADECIIQCKPFLGRPHLIVRRGAASVAGSSRNAIEEWNRRAFEASPCVKCENAEWSMPQCKECNVKNGWKWFKRRTNE